MVENETTENGEMYLPPSRTHKRPSTSDQARTRSKRAKYNPMACNECKKRKMRCNRDDGERECQRCVATGTFCIYVHTPPQAPAPLPPSASINNDLSVGADKYDKEIALLRQQVAFLSNSLKDITDKVYRSTSSPAISQSNHDYSTAVNPRPGEPKQPQFVGHTRSAFGLDVAKTSLTQMGISSDLTQATSPANSPNTSPKELSPVPEEPSDGTSPNSQADPLLTIPLGELIRLVDVFQEEIGSVYPFINTETLTAKACQIVNFLRESIANADWDGNDGVGTLEESDVRILKMAVASAIVLEAHGKNELSRRLVESTEYKSSYISSTSNVDLKELQIMAIMSIYYFHCDEDLLAWRTIGVAARMALEMGLHRKRSLVDNFKTPEDQAKALRVFWCIYALDRRWSFGTSLSFALHDRDIDPELPEPAEDFQYLRCLVSYGRLCSKVWEALPPLGSPSSLIPRDKVDFLEFLTTNWLSSIPEDLQLRHPRLGLAPRNQPRTLHRLRALLYLRGNHMRTLIHRHHVLSTSNIYADIASARLVVDIAKDSIHVLLDLAENTDIYVRQQAAFNYFLISALAVIFLGVCHAPALFAESCRDSFSSTINLVRGFSRGSHASKRLWKSIRGLLPVIKALGQQEKSDKNNDEANRPPAEMVTSNQVPGQEAVSGMAQRVNPPAQIPLVMEQNQVFVDSDLDICTSVPDIYQMSNELVGLFDAFGQTRMGPLIDPMEYFEIGQQPQMRAMEYPAEISRRFHDLIQ